VMIATKYGAAYENIEEKGIAHFIEHLCFKGTEKRTAKEIVSEVEKIGGEINAFTSEEVTAYYAKLPSVHLDVAMDVMFDVFFNANFPEEEIGREAGVICEEIKMYKDNPRAYVVEKIKENLYEAPFGMFIAGSGDVVQGMLRDQLVKRHREVYIPENAILCVVGNNNFDEIVEMAEKLSVEKEGVEKKVPEIKKRVVKNSEKRAGIEQSNLAIGFHFPKHNEDAGYAAEVFSAILGQGMSSKLFTEVREKRGLVYSVKTDLDRGKEYGYMMIWAGTDPAKVDEVIEVCLAEFKKLGNISEEELKEAKVQVIGNRGVESEGSSETAINLILEEISGNAEDYYKYEEKINAVTLDDIKKLARISDYSVFSLGP